MERLQGMVLDFHRAFGHRVAPKPTLDVSMDERALRMALIEEEWDETMIAMLTEDLVGIADGLADLLYVVLGTALTYGIDLEPVFCEVHRANMAKKTGHGPAIGKVQKPAGWQPPRIRAILDMLSERSIG
jgi:predicted HAD superfamily Cof-like phosphohydrolase